MEDKDLYTAFKALGHEGRRQLLRFLAGEASPEEADSVQRWLWEDPRRVDMVRRMHRAQVVDGLAPNLWNADDAFRRLTARLGLADSAGAEGAQDDAAALVQPAPSAEPMVLPFPVRPAATRRGWGQRLGVAARIAATVVLLLGGTLLWQQRDSLFGPVEGPMQELAAGVGERVRLTLADGSQVVLGPNSRIHFPERFGKNRNVRLEGEAVFDVVSDSARPFRVHAGAATTRVLGTRFGVRAFASDEFVEVVVSEGRVEVSAAEMSSDDGASTSAQAPAPRAPHALQLTAGQAVRVSGDGVLGELRAVDAVRHLSWTEGNLYFDRTPLAEVAQLLERRYGAKIGFADQQTAGLLLTAEFLEPGSVSEIVRFIALSLGIEYRRTTAGYLFVHPAS